MSKNDSISMSVIRRLPRYYRFLCELDDRSVERISSTELSKIMNSTASQVRQDPLRGSGTRLKKSWDLIRATRLL